MFASEIEHRFSIVSFLAFLFSPTHPDEIVGFSDFLRFLVMLVICEFFSRISLARLTCRVLRIFGCTFSDAAFCLLKLTYMTLNFHSVTGHSDFELEPASQPATYIRFIICICVGSKPECHSSSSEAQNPQFASLFSPFLRCCSSAAIRKLTHVIVITPGLYGEFLTLNSRPSAGSPTSTTMQKSIKLNKNISAFVNVARRCFHSASVDGTRGDELPNRHRGAEMKNPSRGLPIAMIELTTGGSTGELKIVLRTLSTAAVVACKMPPPRRRANFNCFFSHEWEKRVVRSHPVACAVNVYMSRDCS